jgi:SPP1 family predicted phage head-tail adaptor
MRGGRLRHKLVYEEPTVTQDSRGEDVSEWNTIHTPWAEVRPLSGNELVLARQQAPRTTHEVRTRGPLAVRSIGRFRWGSRLLYVEGSLNDGERNIERVSLCREETV